MLKKRSEGRQLDRRTKPRSQDGFYQLVVSVNFIAWLLLVAALIIFHFARPEFISGVQSYWGIEGREQWSQYYVDSLMTMLKICLATSLITIFLRARRNRRRGDNFGVNLFILTGISVLSLFTLSVTVA